MGVVEYLKEQGREEGLQKGRTEGLQKGLQKGRTEGRTEGREEGIMEGLQRGRAESQERFVASLLGKLHLSDEQIADIAEVSLAFVKKVKRGLHKK